MPFRKMRVVKRYTGEFVKGRWVNNEPEILNVLLGNQPAKPDELVHMPEARRTKQSMTIFSDFELRPHASNGTGDVVVLPEGEFEVVSVEPWRSGIIPHYKALAQRL